MSPGERLERELDGAQIPPGMAQALSQLPAVTVDVVVAALRAVRRAGREDERRARRARREGKVRDVDSLARDTDRIVRRGLAQRATGDLDALAHLHAHFGEGQRLIACAVLALRMDGISDSKIGAALGLSGKYVCQEMNRRFGPRSGASVRPAPARVSADAGGGGFRSPG